MTISSDRKWQSYYKTTYLYDEIVVYWIDFFFFLLKMGMLVLEIISSLILAHISTRPSLSFHRKNGYGGCARISFRLEIRSGAILRSHRGSIGRVRWRSSRCKTIIRCRPGAQSIFHQFHCHCRAILRVMIIVCRPRVQWMRPALLPPAAGTEECQYRGHWRKERERGGLINCGHYQPTISYFSQTHSFRSYSSSFCISPSPFFSSPLSVPSLSFSLSALFFV